MALEVNVLTICVYIINIYVDVAVVDGIYRVGHIESVSVARICTWVDVEAAENSRMSTFLS